MTAPATRLANDSEKLLRQSHIKALQSILELLSREINFLSEMESPLTKILDSKPINFAREVLSFESDLIRCALIVSMGRQNKAAQLLGIKVTTLNAKIKRYKIDIEPSTDQKNTTE